MKNEEQRKKLREEMAEQILFSREATDILGFSRERLNQMVQQDRIVPIRKGIYLKEDILAFKKERDNSEE